MVRNMEIFPPTRVDVADRILDLLHTVMISASNWDYLIMGFGDTSVADHIIWCVIFPA